MKKDLTVFIGRFEPFHIGHAAVLERALKTSKNVLVLVGSSFRSRNTKNPFTYAERRSMIHDYVDQTGLLTRLDGNTSLFVRPLHDHPYNDQEWIGEVQDTVNEVRSTISRANGTSVGQVARANDVEVFLTGCDRDDSTWYLNAFGDFFKKDLVPVQFDDMSATKVRNALFGTRTIPTELLPSPTIRFLKEFMGGDVYEGLIKEHEFLVEHARKWAGAPYTPIFSTVDATVIQSGHVLVIVRDNFPGKGLWALPGGYLEPNERIIDGALRELKEETKIALSDGQLRGSIKRRETFDDPGRSLRGRIITTNFLFKLADTKDLPKIKGQKGEVRKLMWMPISEALANPEMWFEDHWFMLKAMTSGHLNF